MIKKFLSYVEITTKITSVFAFLMTLAYLFYTGRPVNVRLTVIFFAAMFLFDLTTTAINNYIDTKTNRQQLQFSRSAALVIIYILFALSAALGLYLAYLTDIVVLLLGALCFVCGVLYTYGPVPISRQPLGEFFSGSFYGFFIPFLLLYINMPRGTYLTLNLRLESITLTLKTAPLLCVFLLALPPFCTTANIMLANNICDLQKDAAVGRHTLPYYLGAKISLYLFAALYYAVYAAVTLMVLLKILHPVCLLFWLSIIPAQKNISVFFKKQEKSETFITSIKNYVIIMGGISALIFISALIRV
ncbi:MAG: UbiA family prenyltransferase [Spirochaetaceae bacterium]|jgi:1,4-dihydroxy-2-naphthoate octaprenyltransferase|nr:UbiA family prenyltransferase [Spirochaetaceae bacterium]